MPARKDMFRAFDEFDYDSSNKSGIKLLFDSITPHLPALGFPLKLYSDRAVQRLLMLPCTMQKQVIEKIRFRLAILAELETYEPANEKKLTEYALKRLKLSTDQNFLNGVKENDIVEVYSLDNVQAFANFEFFRYCTYSQLDLAVHTWDELFERQSNVTDELVKKIVATMTSGEGVIEYSVRPHIVKERISDERKSFVVYMGQMAPVIDDQAERRFGMIHTLRVRELDMANPFSIAGGEKGSS